MLGPGSRQRVSRRITIGSDLWSSRRRQHHGRFTRGAARSRLVCALVVSADKAARHLRHHEVSSARTCHGRTECSSIRPLPGASSADARCPQDLRNPAGSRREFNTGHPAQPSGSRLLYTGGLRTMFTMHRVQLTCCGGACRRRGLSPGQPSGYVTCAPPGQAGQAAFAFATPRSTPSLAN